MQTSLTILLLGLFSHGVAIAKVSEKNLAFNEQRAPKSTQDLIEIQQALTEQLAQAQSATVSISIGQGFGSGVIVSPEGLILTAAHVTEGVERDLTVILNDGTRHQAVSMGLVSGTDAAMMRITEVSETGEQKVYPYVEINRENDYRLGHWVFALGHSGGFELERGPVLRLGRIVQDSETTLHTDCKIIGGDSGGPLYDLNGRLIAIHSRVSRTVEQNMHVPMREYLQYWEALQNNEFVGDGPFAKRPVKGSGFMGLKCSDTNEGLHIDVISEGGAAEKSGLLVGDIFLQIDSDEVTDKASIEEILKEKAEGDKLQIIVLRNDEEVKINLKLGKK